MTDFDTFRVMHSGTVVLAGGYCYFLLLAKLIQGQGKLFRGQ